MFNADIGIGFLILSVGEKGRENLEGSGKKKLEECDESIGGDIPKIDQLISGLANLRVVGKGSGSPLCKASSLASSCFLFVHSLLWHQTSTGDGSVEGWGVEDSLREPSGCKM